MQRVRKEHKKRSSKIGRVEKIASGVSAMQGWCISMEDAHAAVLDLQVESDKEFQAAGSNDRLSFFDGQNPT